MVDRSHERLAVSVEMDPVANLESLDGSRYDLAWLNLLFSRPSQHWVSNVTTGWGKLAIGDTEMPLTINDAEYENSFVCSPYSGCILYSYSEIRLIQSWLMRLGLRSLVTAMALPLRLGKIDRVLAVNNWLLTTNLYPRIDFSCVPALTDLLVKQFPRHAIAFRSLNTKTNAPLMEHLTRHGYLLAPSRQVYLFDGSSADYLRRSNNRHDQRLLKTTPYQIVEHDQLTERDEPRIEALYRMLYIDKYSPHNPQVTARMFAEFRRRRLLIMWGLRDQCGRLDGIVGMFEREGVMTAPLVGYDTSLPKQRGLYRLLMAIVLKEAAERRVLLNLSSGAAEFKRLRGGEPYLEYTAVYVRHLSPARAMVWHLLAGLLTHIGGPILEKFEL